jgi:hypothetical protein
LKVERWEDVLLLRVAWAEIDTRLARFGSVGGVGQDRNGCDHVPATREHEQVTAPAENWDEYEDDVGIPDHPPPQRAGAGSVEDPGPQWLKVLLWRQSSPPAQVWVTCPAEMQPEGALWVGAAAPPRHGTLGVPIVVSGARAGDVGQDDPQESIGHAADRIADLLAASLARIGETLSQKLAAKRRPVNGGERAGPEGSPQELAKRPSDGTLPDDAFIDQRSERVDRQTYLRLARKGAFPSRRIGKRVVARWGDVKAAMESQHRPVPKPGPSQVDELDGLRVAIGLVPKHPVSGG